MKKTEKRPYLHPTTEVVRFTADIITTSGETGPGHNGSIIVGEGNNSFVDTYGAPSEPDPYL